MRENQHSEALRSIGSIAMSMQTYLSGCGRGHTDLLSGGESLNIYASGGEKREKCDIITIGFDSIRFVS